MKPRKPFYPQVDARVADLFAQNGLSLLGTASPAQGEDTRSAQEHYRGWLAAGNHGDMVWLEKHEPLKYDPTALDPEVKTVLVAALPYFQTRPDTASREGLVARYAWGRDYHKVFLNKLRRVAHELEKAWPEERFRAFTDTSPLDERFWAERAGLAFTGRNELSITGAWGSWFFLGEILSTKFFEPTPAPRHAHGSCPSGCHRCSTSCPTGALKPDGIDARRCIAYLTIEHKGSIPLELRPLMGGWVFGCDVCQDVCPFNLDVPATKESEFLSWKSGPELDLAEILELPDEVAFTLRFGGSPVHRAGFSGLRRNACIAAANRKRKDLLPFLKNLAKDTNPVVAEAAAWAVETLEKDYT